MSRIARYNSNDKIWRGIPGDRTLEFGAVQRENDVEAYRGVEHDLKAFDELGEFTKKQYEFLITWNRSSDPEARCRVVATCNPPSSEESMWIKEYWGAWLNPEHPNPALPGEIRWYAMVDDVETEVPNGEAFEHNGEMLEPRSRTFIPSRLEDNAYLRNSNYRGVLQRLPEPLRSQLLRGDFTTVAKQDDPWQVIPSVWVNLAIKRWTPVPNAPQSHLGVDVARGGKAESIIVSRHHYWIAPIIAFPGTETPDGDSLADQIAIVRKSAKVEIRVDTIGVGYAVVDALNRRGAKLVFGLNGGGATEVFDKSGLLQFFNLRSRWWWHLRELLDPANGYNVALPNDPKLIADLTTPRWYRTGSRNKFGEIRIEAKEDIMKRLGGRSCDRGDALAYSFAEDVDDASSYDWMNQL
ncbi:hypothetical protein [Nostoc sp. NMS7]|uniref:hypothetical protein n=1 Tax=Nostoc sp. NMS7 TaxID=2815391 RepID=UPI0025E02B28|nr:hypothetical protein [Nostoc sp. NMS7]